MNAETVEAKAISPTGLTYGSAVVSSDKPKATMWKLMIYESRYRMGLCRVEYFNDFKKLTEVASGVNGKTSWEVVDGKTNLH